MRYASLRPYDAFHRCTLHFVSAAGSRPNLQGFRPTHVLDPLVAILAMTGVIADPQAEKVGLP